MHIKFDSRILLIGIDAINILAHPWNNIYTKNINCRIIYSGKLLDAISMTIKRKMVK